MTIERNDKFQQALDLMETTNQNLFITGKAGTGKSTLLDYFCNHTSKNPVILAPTGIAALNVKGQTIHRFFNFYIDITQEKIIKKLITPRKPELYKKLQTIIIDEVSMLRADLLDCIDIFLSIYGPQPKKPFGGVQMIFIGDLYQLPPVIMKDERDIFKTHYETPFFFSAKVLERTELEIVELDKVYRQKDGEFIELLNKVRNNAIEDDDIEKLNQRYVPLDKADYDQGFTINLTTTNAKADEINDRNLNALSGGLYASEAIIKGEFGKESYPTVINLQFKIGAQIMLLNNDQWGRWVNGTIGIIEAIKSSDEGEYIDVRLQENHKLVSVWPFEWEIFQNSVEAGQIVTKPAGSFEQFPFRLAWAVTIHKSQGKTFSSVVIDMNHGSFASGQTYVALSRCTSFQGIKLAVPIKKQHIRTDPRIYKFLTSMAYKKATDQLSLEERINIISQAIKKKQKIEMTYLKANDTKSKRVILPLTLQDEEFKGHVFPGMMAHCTLRGEDRMFNITRILDLKII